MKTIYMGTISALEYLSRLIELIYEEDQGKSTKGKLPLVHPEKFKSF